MCVASREDLLQLFYHSETSMNFYLHFIKRQTEAQKGKWSEGSLWQGWQQFEESEAQRCWAAELRFDPKEDGFQESEHHISEPISTLGKRCWWLYYSRTSLVAQWVKNPPAIQETQVRSLGWKDPLEKSMVTHSSILAWRTPWTEEPSGLQSMGSQRVRHDWVTLSFFTLCARHCTRSWGYDSK